MRTAAVVAIIMLFVGIMMLAGRSDVQHRPHCPTEDSCTLDYRHGQWYIDGVQVTR